MVMEGEPVEVEEKDSEGLALGAGERVEQALAESAEVWEGTKEGVGPRDAEEAKLELPVRDVKGEEEVEGVEDVVRDGSGLALTVLRLKEGEARVLGEESADTVAALVPVPESEPLTAAAVAVIEGVMVPPSAAPVGVTEAVPAPCATPVGVKVMVTVAAEEGEAMELPEAAMPLLLAAGEVLLVVVAAREGEAMALVLGRGDTLGEEVVVPEALELGLRAGVAEREKVTEEVRAPLGVPRATLPAEADAAMGREGDTDALPVMVLVGEATAEPEAHTEELGVEEVLCVLEGEVVEEGVPLGHWEMLAFTLLVAMGDSVRGEMEGE